MRTSRDNNQFCTDIVRDLSPVLDSKCYNWLIAKLNAYGFDNKALKLILLPEW